MLYFLKSTVTIFLFCYPWLSPFFAILLSIYLTRRIKISVRSNLITWLLVVLANLAAFFPVIFGGTGFALVVPWFAVIFYPGAIQLSEELSVFSAGYILFVSTIIVSFVNEKKATSNEDKKILL